MIKNINYLFVTFFGIGTIRYAPGTITSLITTIFLFSSFHILNVSNTIVLIVLIAISLYAFYAVANYIKDESNKDPKEIVIDEVIGQSIPIYLYEISHGTNKESKEAILFYKKFKNSFGVIIDDVIAGFYVVLTLVIFMVIKSKLFA